MKPSKLQEQNAAFFQALSHRRRQMLCDILLNHSSTGLSFGQLQHHSGLKPASLAHHLRFMDQGGILRRMQKGRETWISIDAAHLRNATTKFSSHRAKSA